MPRPALGALLGALLLGLAACDPAPRRATLSGATMGTTWSVVYADAAGVSAADLRRRIERELEAINAVFSTYRPDSEISRLNRRAGAAPVQLSARFAEVLDAALAIGELSDGAYDVTVGPLVELWGFGAGDFSGAAPEARQIAEARRRVGSGRLRWDRERRLLTRPRGMRVDLSSIAKGYAEGLENTLTEIGGELRVSGERPEGGPWRLAVESPDPAAGRFVDALNLRDAAVATSGDYRNFFEVDGRRYSHLLDPRTGYPVAHELVSVTVVHRDCMTADALATALIVLGPEQARALADREGLAAQFVSRAADGLEVDYTASFAAYRAAPES